MRLTLPCSKWHYEMSKPCYPSCLLSCPTLWDLNGLVLSLVEGFFGESPTQAGVCLIFNICSFRYHANTFLLMCGSRGRRLVINSFYHTCILSILNPFSYYTTYLFWLTTSYYCPFFTMLTWSYHWRFK